MDQIIVDESFTRQLGPDVGPCIVLDSTGKRLGCFTPEVDSSLYHGMGPSVSEEELDRRERTGGGRSLTEILSDLRHQL